MTGNSKLDTHLLHLLYCRGYLASLPQIYWFQVELLGCLGRLWQTLRGLSELDALEIA
jgi:hypothetical protein